MLRAQRAAISQTVFGALSAIAASLAPSLASAQSNGASVAPVELAPMRVGPAPTEIRVEEPIVVEATAPRDTQRSTDDGRALENPFGPTTPESGSQPVADADRNDAQPSATARTSSARDPRGGGAVFRCAPSQRSYFDERSQLYRPCSDNTGPSRAVPAARAGSRSWRSEAIAHCRAGGQSYFDERDQLYRPCPVSPDPAANRSSSAARQGAGRYAPPAGTNTRCTAGARVYFDQREGLFRPCPSP